MDHPANQIRPLLSIFMVVINLRESNQRATDVRPIWIHCLLFAKFTTQPLVGFRHRHSEVDPIHVIDLVLFFYWTLLIRTVFTPNGNHSMSFYVANALFGIYVPIVKVREKEYLVIFI